VRKNPLYRIRSKAHRVTQITPSVFFSLTLSMYLSISRMFSPHTMPHRHSILRSLPCHRRTTTSLQYSHLGFPQSIANTTILILGHDKSAVSLAAVDDNGGVDDEGNEGGDDGTYIHTQLRLTSHRCRFHTALMRNAIIPRLTFDVCTMQRTERIPTSTLLRPLKTV
jgi:hypothetical protein